MLKCHPLASRCGCRLLHRKPSKSGGRKLSAGYNQTCSAVLYLVPLISTFGYEKSVNQFFCRIICSVGLSCCTEFRLSSEICHVGGFECAPFRCPREPIGVDNMERFWRESTGNLKIVFLWYQTCLEGSPIHGYPSFDCHFLIRALKYDWSLNGGNGKLELYQESHSYRGT